MASHNSSTQVQELDPKLSQLKMKLRLKTNKELADRLGGIHPSNLSQWTGENHGFVPNSHLQRMADMIGMSAARFAASSAAEFDKEIEHFQPDTTPWQSVIKRAHRALIALRPVLPSARPVFAVRGVVQSSRWAEYDAQEERFHIGDRICVDLSVPWDFFKTAQRVQTLLLASDERGTALVTPALLPLSVNRQQGIVTVPPAGPQDPFVITQPPGMQAFTALFFDEPLDATLAAELDAAASRRPAAINYLEATELNALATHLLPRDPWRWAVAHKRFVVGAR